MSWLFSQALVAEYSAATSWDGAPSAPLSMMQSPHPFSRNGKTMDASQLSRSGLTCAVLTEGRGEDLLTWFRGASPVPTSPSAGMAPDWTAKQADCGWSSAESSMKYDPDTRTWRTRQCSLLGGLAEFSETWPNWGSMHDGECSAHTMPAWTTCGHQYTVWRATVSAAVRTYPNPDTIGRAINPNGCVGHGMGGTPLIAAMRAIVASFGPDQAGEK